MGICPCRSSTDRRITVTLTKPRTELTTSRFCVFMRRSTAGRRSGIMWMRVLLNSKSSRDKAHTLALIIVPVAPARPPMTIIINVCSLPTLSSSAPLIPMPVFRNSSFSSWLSNPWAIFTRSSKDVILALVLTSLVARTISLMKGMMGSKELAVAMPTLWLMRRMVAPRHCNLFRFACGEQTCRLATRASWICSSCSEASWVLFEQRCAIILYAFFCT
mmetsp:Transcript_29100/g.35338  ORF Transcript_29100/g.35338 Transcript_29100/m.35338 type:complete len:218 (-) Transcript_29100:521-1174(-)